MGLKANDKYILKGGRIKMMRPFCLYGQTITLFHYSLSYKDRDGVSQERGCVTMRELEVGQTRLEEEGASDFVTAELDLTDVEWLEGITVDEGYSMEQAVEIWQMGKTAYMEKINTPTIEEYLVDLDFRMSKVELGI